MACRGLGSCIIMIGLLDNLRPIPAHGYCDVIQSYYDVVFWLHLIFCTSLIWLKYEGSRRLRAFLSVASNGKVLYEMAIVDEPYMLGQIDKETRERAITWATIIVWFSYPERFSIFYLGSCRYHFNICSCPSSCPCSLFHIEIVLKFDLNVFVSFAHSITKADSSFLFPEVKKYDFWSNVHGFVYSDV